MQKVDISRMMFRQFHQLAADRSYDISESEISFYVEKLGHHGFKKICEALLSFIADTTIDDNVFPSILEFEKVILSLKKAEDSSLSLQPQTEEHQQCSLKIVT